MCDISSDYRDNDYWDYLSGDNMTQPSVTLGHHTFIGEYKPGDEIITFSIPSLKEHDNDVREKVLDELWKFCLINGAEEHGDIIGLPKDLFFPLKLLKKIAEMRYAELRQKDGE